MTIGNLLGGRLADGNLPRTLIGALLALAVAQTLLALTSAWLVPLVVFIFAVGAASAVTSPAIQTRLMDVAGENQSIAAALNHSALNIGNSLGAFLGGVVITLGWGFTMPAWVGVALALAGVGLAALSFGTERRTASPADLEGARPPASAPQPVATGPTRTP
nr:MFS transporter [Microbacterium sp. LRZ72]